MEETSCRPTRPRRLHLGSSSSFSTIVVVVVVVVAAVAKSSAVGQLTRPTQPFILLGSINE